jgi:hypothetical protein
VHRDDWDGNPNRHKARAKSRVFIDGGAVYTWDDPPWTREFIINTTSRPMGRHRRKS